MVPVGVTCGHDLLAMSMHVTGRQGWQTRQMDEGDNRGWWTELAGEVTEWCQWVMPVGWGSV